MGPTRSLGLRRAIAACGSITELARRLGISAGTITSDWWRVPPRRVVEVARATGLDEQDVAE